MAETTARRVADTILSLSRDRQLEISNLKLQKLLYYAQAWYLVFNGRPLFDDPIEAWVHGPVVARVFGDFKQYRWAPIDAPVTPLDSPEVRDHLVEVLWVYGDYTATELERLTHSEKPWRDARGELAPDEPSRNVISHRAMREFYSDLANG